MKFFSDFINSYLLAVGRGNGSSDLFVAESRPFILSQTILISFFKHLMSAPTSLKICIMNFTYCPNTFRVNVTQRGWHSAIVELRPESLPLEFQNKPVKVMFQPYNINPLNHTRAYLAYTAFIMSLAHRSTLTVMFIHTFIHSVSLA